MSAAEIWTLHHDDRLVARLQVTDYDLPWLRASVERVEGFEEVAPLFEEELRLLDELDEVETTEWAAAYRAIREATRLVGPDGCEPAEYLLHIDGNEAWWRWEDEPFPAEDA